MRTVMMSIVAAVALLTVSSVASAQYPSSWYWYNLYPGGGSYTYTISNGYETASVTESVGYGSGYYSYSYRGPYGNSSWYQTYPVLTYYPTYYPTYYYVPTCRWPHSHHHHHR